MGEDGNRYSSLAFGVGLYGSVPECPEFHLRSISISEEVLGRKVQSVKSVPLLGAETLPHHSIHKIALAFHNNDASPLPGRQKQPHWMGVHVNNQTCRARCRTSVKDIPEPSPARMDGFLCTSTLHNFYTRIHTNTNQHLHNPSASTAQLPYRSPPPIIQLSFTTKRSQFNKTPPLTHSPPLSAV